MEEEAIHAKCLSYSQATGAQRGVNLDFTDLTASQA